MASRLNLHEELCDILGTNKVYYSPPESIKLVYPCIRYSLSGVRSFKADDMNYKNTNQYQIIVIDRDPDSKIHEDILNHFSMCSFDRCYVAENLHHYVLTLYY